MTKAKQKETAKIKIENRIICMRNAQDMPCLESFYDEIFSMIRLCFQLEILTKSETQELESMQLDFYIIRKEELIKSGIKTA